MSGAVPNVAKDSLSAVVAHERQHSMAESPEGKDVKIEKGRVINVNVRDYTVDVRTEFTYKTIENLAFMVPYCHGAQGEGINFMPEVGSVCWYCVPSDNPTKGFVLGWGMAHENGAYRSGRELLNPGDIMFSSRDGNFVYIRRGGIIQIGATPVCQTVYLPIRNIIQQFCENYELHTPGGDLTWTVDRQEGDMGGHKNTTFILAAHEFADDPANKPPIALLKVGSHGDGNPTILTLQTRDKGGGAVQTELTISKTGTVSWRVTKAVSFAFLDNFTLFVGKDATVIAQSLAVTASTTIALRAPQVAVSADGATMAMSAAGASLDGPAVQLGDAEFAAVMASPSFRAWVDAVTLAIRGGGPGQPLVGVPLNAPLYQSSKVKV